MRHWSTGGHRERLSEVELSDDGASYVTADQLGAVNVWSVPDGTLRQSFQHSGVIGIGVAHRHPWVVTAGHHGSAHLWHLADDRPLTRLPTAMNAVRCAAFSPDDRLLLMGGASGANTIAAWTLLANGQLYNHPAIPIAVTVWWLSFLNSHEAAIATDSGNILRWTIEQRGAQRRFRAATFDTLAQAIISPDGRWLVHTESGLAVTSLVGLGESTADQQVLLDADFPGFYPVAFSPDGKYLVSVRESVCTVWSTTTWRPVRTFSPTLQRIIGIQFHNNGAQLGAQLEGHVYIPSSFSWFAFPSGAAAPALPAHVGRSVSQKTRRFVFDGDTAFQMQDGDRVLWQRSGGGIVGYQSSADAAQLAVEMIDGRIEICDAATGDVNAVCLTPQGMRGRLAFSPDGRMLASCRDPDYQITLWHVATGTKLLDINPGLSTILSLAFAPDGQWIVVAGQSLDGYGEVLLLRYGEPEA